MFEMAKNSMILFARGKLFKDLGSVIMRALIGIVITAILFVACAFYLSAGMGWTTPGHIYTAAAIAGLLGGALQPILFKDLKYA